MSENQSPASQTTRMVLASTSPRRHELIKHLRVPFEIIASEFEEIIDPALDPDTLVLSLAAGKAQEVLQRLRAENGDSQQKLLVLGADTIVVLDGKYLGKPKDKADAVQMLQKLSGRQHEVYTGTVLLISDRATSETVMLREVEVSQVFFREVSDVEIEEYVQTKEPMDKAGAYALQGTGSAFVQRIEGCFTNIIGLPIPKVVSLLRQAGVTVLGLAEPLH